MFSLLHMPSNRIIQLLMLVFCITLFGVAYYLQYQQGLTPCNLCILQRLAYFAIAVIALIALLHSPALIGQRIYAGGLFIASIFGLLIAARQVWLQHLPADKIPDCGPGLDYIMEVFPINEAIQMILSGSGECAKVQWQFLSLSIPEWSILAFLCLLAASVCLFSKKSA